MDITVDMKSHKDLNILSEGWLFSFCLFGIFLLIIVLILIRKYRLSKKHQIDKTQSHDKDARTNKTLQHHEYIETQHEYEEIDDNLLVANPYPSQQQHTLVSIDTCRNRSSEISAVGSDGSYLNPCEIQENEFGGRNSSTALKDSSLNERRDSSAYFNPYQPLQQSSERKVHDYETNIIVHRAVAESCDVKAIHNMHLETF
ncbi:Hypothetical predicted protein [Mytilus galloprovincialis]|uniref:Uncharacterized protein n=1 Tax=Mytilus galloprovincialis TaxID=29158 RepID=A0A8B6E053_MYTGA|nr:Hypothetical predicted protein [Mytilus galloprovincialis]